MEIFYRISQFHTVATCEMWPFKYESLKLKIQFLKNRFSFSVVLTIFQVFKSHLLLVATIPDSTKHFFITRVIMDSTFMVITVIIFIHKG